MHRIVLVAMCAACVSGCVTVNGGSRPMGSIIGKTETTPSVAEQLTKAVPGSQWLARR
jgi:hypothetical protein